MAVPAVIAFNERDNILKTIFYLFLAIAVLYMLWNIFKKVDNASKVVTNTVSETTNEVEYRLNHPGEAPARFAKAVMMPETTLEKLQQFAYNIVNPFNSLASKVVQKAAKDEEYREQVKDTMKTSVVSGIVPGYGAYKALKNLLHKDEKQSGVQPRNISMEEYKDLQAKRWEAIAKYYEKQKIPEKWGAKPVEPPHILPVKRDLRVL